MAAHALASPTARRGFVRQFFQFCIQQNPGVYGPGTLERLDASFLADGENIRNLLADQAALAALHGILPPEQAATETPRP